MRVAWVLLLAGCPSEPLVRDYSNACDTPADCVVLVDQGYCGSCDRYAVLDEVGAPEFEQDQERYDRRHHCRGVILIGCTGLGPAPEAACIVGVCRIP